MKVFLILGILFLAFLAGCQFSENGDVQIKPPETEDENSDSTNEEEAPVNSQEQDAPPPEVTEIAPVSVFCEDEEIQDYFSISFPDNWGDLEQTINCGTLSTRISWTSLEDPDRSLRISIIPTERRTEPSVIDYPQTLFAENQDYGFYYSSGGSYAGMPGNDDQKFYDIQKEAEAIVQSFKFI